MAVSNGQRGEELLLFHLFLGYIWVFKNSLQSCSYVQANGVKSEVAKGQARGQKRPAPPEVSEAAEQNEQMDGQHARPAKKACHVRPPQRNALAMLIGS